MHSFRAICRPLKNCARLHTTSVLLKPKINYSLVPILNELELDEKFVKGSGPGGSAVNKNANCVVLKHKPTGIVIKCHMSRCLDENRKKARELLIKKLDDRQNGEESVSAQFKKINDKKQSAAEYKKKKLDQLKIEWREREGLP